MIKCYAVDASAGPGRFPLSEAVSGGMAFSRSWLLKRGISADLAGLITVKGDSMVPTIPDGAMVLVHLADYEVTAPGIYVFNRGGQTCIKRLTPVAGENGKLASLVIVSDNAAYPPDVVSGPALNELRIIGRVRSILIDA